MAILPRLAEIAPCGPVTVAVHIGEFQEFAIPRHPVEFLHANEVILLSILLAATRGTRGIGN